MKRKLIPINHRIINDKENEYTEYNFGIFLDKYNKIDHNASAEEIINFHLTKNNYYLNAFDKNRLNDIKLKIKKLLDDNFVSILSNDIKEYIFKKYGISKNNIEIVTISINGSYLYSQSQKDPPHDIDNLVVINIKDNRNLIIRDIVFDFNGFPGYFPQRLEGMVIETVSSVEKQSQHTHTTVALLSHLGAGITIYGKTLNDNKYPLINRLIHAKTLLENSRSRNVRKKLVRLSEVFYIINSDSKLLARFSDYIDKEKIPLRNNLLDWCWTKIDELYFDQNTQKDLLKLNKEIDEECTKIREKIEYFLSTEIKCLFNKAENSK